MKKLSILAGACVLASTAVPAATLTVGPTTGTHATVALAIAASSPGDDISIIENAVYDETISMPAGDLIIDIAAPATLGGVVFTPTSSGGITFDGTVTATHTIRNIVFNRSLGTGAGIDIDQPATGITHTINLENVTMVTTGTAREALKFDDGSGPAGGNVIFTATGCDFDASGADTGDRAAVRVQADVDDFDNLTATFTNCFIRGEATTQGAAFRLDDRLGGSTFEDHTWLIDGCTITAPQDKGFEIDDPSLNCSFTIQDSTITCEEEAFQMTDPHNSAAITLKRNTINNSAGAAGDHAIDIRPGAGTGNTLDVFNNLIITQGGQRTLHFGGGAGLVAQVYHNTFIGGAPVIDGSPLDPGPVGDRAVSIDSGPIGALAISNNLAWNFADPIGGSTSGSTRTRNVIAGAVDDTSFGGDRRFDTIAAANLDDSFTPQTPTNTGNFGDNSGAILAAVENVDRLGNPRINGGTRPDVGSFESAAVPVELSAFGLD